MNRRIHSSLVVLLFLVLSTTTIALVPLPAPANDESSQETAKTEAKEDVSADDSIGLPRDDEYYELLKLFADTLDQIDRNYVKGVSRRDLMEAAIEGMLSKLDQYSNYIAPEEVDRFKVSVEGQLEGGIGIQVQIIDGQLTVISPIVGSPAYKAGLLAGDKITEIEGETTEGITLSEAVQRMKGKVGTVVTVTVIHLDDPMPKKVEIERANVRLRTVTGERRNADQTWNFMYDEEYKIGYMRVTAFSNNTVREMRDALRQLFRQDMKGLVLDLRFNPGGLLRSAIEVCDMFISEGQIVSTKGRNIKDRSWSARRRGTFPHFPMVILVNRFSASASEIVSACLQDHERALIVGERTFGKGSVQNIIELEGGKSALKLTTAGYKRPSGKNIHRFEDASEDDDWGVRPDEGYKVELSVREMGQFDRYRREQEIVRDRSDDEEQPKFVDRQLSKAIDYLKEQLADSSDQSSESAVSDSASAAEKSDRPDAAAKEKSGQKDARKEDAEQSDVKRNGVKPAEKKGDPEKDAAPAEKP